MRTTDCTLYLSDAEYGRVRAAHMGGKLSFSYVRHASGDVRFKVPFGQEKRFVGQLRSLLPDVDDLTFHFGAVAAKSSYRPPVC